MGKGRELDSCLGWGGGDPGILTPNRQLILWRERGLKSQPLCLQPRVSNYRLSPSLSFLTCKVGLVRLTSW